MLLERHLPVQLQILRSKPYASDSPNANFVQLVGSSYILSLLLLCLNLEMLQTECHWLKLQDWLTLTLWDLVDPVILGSIRGFLFCAFGERLISLLLQNGRPDRVLQLQTQTTGFKPFTEVFFFFKMTGHHYVILGSSRPGWFCQRPTG